MVVVDQKKTLLVVRKFGIWVRARLLGELKESFRQHMQREIKRVVALYVGQP